jgi:propane monooxygenase small subunit
VLFSMLTNDEAHGAENKATLQGWLDTYTPAAVNAARNLQPIWSQLSEKVVRFEDSFDRSRERFEGVLADVGLETPKEVAA